MAKTSGDFEKEFIETAKEKTGKSLAEWLVVVKASGLSKMKELTDWGKKEHGLNHLQATLLAGLYLNDGKPFYQNEDNLLENQFAKCADMRGLFDELTALILKTYPDTQLIPKKTYLSFTAKREFLAVNAKANELRLGFDLGDRVFDEVVQKSKLSGPMPRMSHMLVIHQAKDLNDFLLNLTKNSYLRSNTK